MGDAEKKDAQDPCSQASETKPVNFVTVLWEELQEIRKLRGKRDWHKRDTFWQAATPAANAAAAETAEAEQEPELPLKPTDGQEDQDKVFAAAHNEELVGLAFSGGGIRSATFNLGVLQGFAKFNLLPMFDYLSTVSGGGYIGGWLESWIYRAGKVQGDSDAAKQEAKEAEQVARCADPSVASLIDNSPIRRVQECVKPDRSTKIDHAESQAIRFLREYSNYLTPRMGFLGADTWTAVAIYLRNLFLNQTILILFMGFLLLVPYVAVFLTKQLHDFDCKKFVYAGPWFAFVLLFIAFFGVGWNMRNLSGVGSTGEFPPRARQGHILRYVALPATAAAWCMSAGIWRTQLWNHRWWWWSVFGVGAFFVAWWPVALWGFFDSIGKDRFYNHRTTRLESMGWSLISGGVGGILLWVVADQVIRRWDRVEGNIWHVVSFGPPLVIIVLLLTVTLQIGLMGMLMPEPRREWWGRLGGWMLLICLLWAGASALSIYSPLAVLWSRKFVTWASVVWVLNTAIGVLGGKSGKTGSPESNSWTDMALSVTPYVFIVGLGAGLATLLEIVLGKLNSAQCFETFLKGSLVTRKIVAWTISLNWYSIAPISGYRQATMVSATAPSIAHPLYISAHWQTLSYALHCRTVAFAAAVFLVCWFLSWRVDLNEFSMNLFYRNRLVRCYLGASHKFRKPNPFSGFDPHDDLFVSSLRSEQGYGGPLPIVNTALNLVTGQNLAWQERKAESFVITPLRCGFDTWLERLDLDAEVAGLRDSEIAKYGFRPAECCLHPNKFYAPGGFRLGTAISISGAAASPNMGYHSSPSLAFLMTFFNVRLGFWTGNPRHNSTWKNAGPTVGLFHLIAELFGQSDDEAPYVYLSDGGHFENLGLYELVKRRCKYIVVCDADADGGYAFGDLGGAIRKCREDIGVEITLVTDDVRPSKPSASGNSSNSSVSDGTNGFGGNFCQKHWAIGRIHYNQVDPDAADGIVVYLKTSLTGDEPADVLNYHREHANFPHQTTADQWFTESQFESYRRLGQHVVEKLFDELSLTHEVNGTIATRKTAAIFNMLMKASEEKKGTAKPNTGSH